MNAWRRGQIELADPALTERFDPGERGFGFGDQAFEIDGSFELLRGAQLGKPLPEEAHRPSLVPARDLVERHRHLDQPLIELALEPTALDPDFLEEIMRFEVEAGVEEPDPFFGGRRQMNHRGHALGLSWMVHEAARQVAQTRAGVRGFIEGSGMVVNLPMIS